MAEVKGWKALGNKLPLENIQEVRILRPEQEEESEEKSQLNMFS